MTKEFSLNRYIACGKCGGTFSFERDRYGDLIVCINCGNQDYIKLDLSAVPYQIESCHTLNTNTDDKRYINTSGYSSWLPQGVSW